MNRIRTLIVDDEPLARASLRVLASADQELELVGECPDGKEAAEAIRCLRPDLIFLDVRMPRLDGVAMLEELQSPAPLIIFVTAHQEHAVRAFEEGAVDYLLKPFDDQRFATAVARAKERLQTRTAEAEGTVVRAQEDTTYPSRLLVKGTGRTVVVKVEDIDWLGGAGNYVRLHLGPRRILHRATIQDMVEQLDPSRFARIHRSLVVNVDRVQELEPVTKGAWKLCLLDGTELRLSATYREALEARLAGRLH